MNFIPGKVPSILRKGRVYVYISVDPFSTVEKEGFTCTVENDVVVTENMNITITALSASKLPRTYSVTIGRPYMVSPRYMRETENGDTIYAKLLGKPR